MSTIVTNMGEGFLELLVVLAVITVAVAVHAVLQRRLKTEQFRKHNDVAGFLFSAVGVIYAVVLGFVVVVVWQKFDNTVSNVNAEIAAVSDLYRTSSGLPASLRTQVRGELRKYVDAMIHVEWPLMKDSVIVGPDLALIEKLAHQINTFVPTTVAQSDVHQMAMSDVEKLFDARRLRLIRLTPAVPLVLWFALIAGAVAMIFFAFFFGVEDYSAQLVMTAILAGLIAILFIVIAEFDSPFSGSVSISSNGWLILQQHLPYIP